MTEPLTGNSAKTNIEKTARDSFVTICGRVFHTDPQYFPQATYRGRTIFLCTDTCLDAFLSDPDRFVAAHKKKSISKGEASTTSEVCPPEHAA